MKKTLLFLLNVMGILALYRLIMDFYVPEIHTTKEWAERADKISVRGKWYVVSDYRTDNDVDIPRFKFGDGKTLVSKLPFCTAAITDNDVQDWDDIAMDKIK